MIISRYISKEIIVNICWVSLVLFGLVLLSRFNMFLSQAEVGRISAENILFALVLFSPGLINLVFPVSVFLAMGFVLTPLFRNHEAVLTAGSMTTGRLLASQKYLILGIFSISVLLSTFLAPYFTSKVKIYWIKIIHLLQKFLHRMVWYLYRLIPSTFLVIRIMIFIEI